MTPDIHSIDTYLIWTLLEAAHDVSMEGKMEVQAIGYQQANRLRTMWQIIQEVKNARPEKYTPREREMLDHLEGKIKASWQRNVPTTIKAPWA